MADKKISALTASTTPLAGSEVLPIVQGGSTVKVSVANLTAGRAVAASSISTTGDVYVGATGSAFAEKLRVFGNYAVLDNGTYTGFVGAGASIGAGGATDFSLRSQAGMAFAVGGTTLALQFSAAANVTVNTGNLVIGTAGKGIDFSANGGDVLSQYDEGTFTPAVAFNNLSTGVTYSTRTGAYTRIGRCVYFSIDIVLTSKGSATGNMTVTGLPLTSMATNAYGVSFADWYDFNFLTVSPIYGKINPSNTNISMFRQAMAGYVQAITDAEVQNNTQFRVSGFYFV